MGYSPWGCKESDMTEQLTLYLLINVEGIWFFNSENKWGQKKTEGRNARYSMCVLDNSVSIHL